MIIQQEQFQIPISSSSKSSIPSQAMITASKNSSHAKERGIFNKILSKYLNDFRNLKRSYFLKRQLMFASINYVFKNDVNALRVGFLTKRAN